MAERLQKVLARAGVASRRKAEVLIRQGKVTVNGIVAELGAKVAPSDEVRVGGTKIQLHETVTYMLYKPRGVLSTVSDERGRPTVMSYVPETPGLHPVGRLDLDSEGLLLLSNDGNLTLELTHPRFGHRKTYRVWCAEGEVTLSDIARLRAGVLLDDGPSRAIRAEAAEGGARVVLEEGRKRQLRRMLAALGYRVTRLRRTRIGDLGLGDLRPGEYRELEARDFAALGLRP